MATPVRGPAVEQIEREHESLGRQIRELAECLSVQGGEESQAIPRLKRLQAEIQRHFSAEERDGYFDDAVAAAPHLAAQASALRSEHGTLLTMLVDLVMIAEEMGPRISPRSQMSVAFDEFRRMFQKHEEAENRLVHEAYFRENAAED